MSPRRGQPKRGGKSQVVIPGDPADPAGFHRLGSDWLEWLTVHNYSPATVIDRSFYLARFVTWVQLRGITQPGQVTLSVLEAYQRHISLHRKKDGAPLGWRTQHMALIPIRLFFSWCVRQRHLTANPASEMVMPRQDHKLPSATLSHEEAEQVLALPDVGTVLGLRDRTVMELLYATAMRRGELVGLDLPDIDLPRQWLTLRHTKTRWDRVVPMGERATQWLIRYLADSRPQLLVGEDPGAVFLAANGERLGATWLTGQVHRYIDASGVGKTGSCHLFRHTAATLMVEHGADIRYVQELLGHRNLSSTHLYTRVAPQRLAAIHAATHPGATLPTGTD